MKNKQGHGKLINELDELIKKNENLETVVQEYKDIDIPIYQGIRFRCLVKINIIFLIMKYMRSLELSIIIVV